MRNRKTLLNGDTSELDLELMKSERDRLLKLSKVSSPQRANIITSTDLGKHQNRSSLDGSKENAKIINKDRSNHLYSRDVPMKDSSNCLLVNTIARSPSGGSVYQKITKQQNPPKTSLISIETQTDGTSADSIPEELNENYLKNLEADLDKIRIENIRLKNELKSANETLAALRQDENNTSSSFALPSEFKSSWETLMKDSLVNVFLDFIDKPFVFVHLVQELVILSISEAEKAISEMNNKVSQLLNLSNGVCNPVTLMNKLRSIYQNHSKEIFRLTEEKSNHICDSYRQSCKPIFFGHSSPYVQCMLETENKMTEGTLMDDDELKSIEEQGTQVFEEMLKSSDFNTFIQDLFSLSIYIQLAEPKLKIPLEPFSTRVHIYQKYQKNKFTCVDGFAKDGSPCIQVLPSVMRNNYPFVGIRPCVLILPEELLTEEIHNKIKCLEEETQNESTGITDEKGSHTMSKNPEVGTDVYAPHVIKDNTHKIIPDQLEDEKHDRKQKDNEKHESSLIGLRCEKEKTSTQQKGKLMLNLNYTLPEESSAQATSTFEVRKKSIQTDRTFCTSEPHDTSLNLKRRQHIELPLTARANTETRDSELVLSTKSKLQVKLGNAKDYHRPVTSDSTEHLQQNMNKINHELSTSIDPDCSPKNNLIREIQSRIKATSKMAQKTKKLDGSRAPIPSKISKITKETRENLKEHASSVLRSKKKANEESFKGKASKVISNANIFYQNREVETNVGSSIDLHDLRSSYSKNSKKLKNRKHRMDHSNPIFQSCANLTSASLPRDSRSVTPHQNREMYSGSKSPCRELRISNEIYGQPKIRYIQQSGEKIQGSASKKGKFSDALRDESGSHILSKPPSGTKNGYHDKIPGIEISEVCFRLSVDRSCESTRRVGSETSELLNSPSNSDLKTIGQGSINHTMNLLNAIELSKKKQNLDSSTGDHRMKVAKKVQNEKSKMLEMLKNIHKNHQLKK